VSRHTAGNSGTKKTTSRAYYFTVDDGQTTKSIRICRDMFINTLDINSALVHYALQNKRAVKGDIHGCHEPICRTPELSASRVSQHISKFPRHVSHNCRSSSAKEYLKGVSGITDMYRLISVQ